VKRLLHESKRWSEQSQGAPGHWTVSAGSECPHPVTDFSAALFCGVFTLYGCNSRGCSFASHAVRWAGQPRAMTGQATWRRCGRLEVQGVELETGGPERWARRLSVRQHGTQKTMLESRFARNSLEQDHTLVGEKISGCLPALKKLAACGWMY
jgi:hypothetical protein